MTSQIRRAGVSICCNLAEGSARISPVDQNRFYEIAFGSAIEVINLLIISKEMELISDTDYVNLRSELEKITYQINQMSGKKPNKTVGVKGIQ